MQLLTSKPFNLIAFNLMWIGCVLGREQWLWLVAPAVLGYLALLIGTRTLLLHQLVVPAAIGLTADLLMTLGGLFAFDNAPLLLPAWLVILWLAFSSTLNLSLSIIGRNKWLAALAGALAFPFNYGVGERLGAVEFPLSHAAALVALAVTWMLLLPVLFKVSERRFINVLQASG